MISMSMYQIKQPIKMCAASCTKISDRRHTVMKQTLFLFLFLCSLRTHILVYVYTVHLYVMGTSICSQSLVMFGNFNFFAMHYIAPFFPIYKNRFGPFHHRNKVNPIPSHPMAITLDEQLYLSGLVQ